jgi:uncharacterized RDD family membrane protein YckC
MQPGAGRTPIAAPGEERASLITPEAVVLDLGTASLGSRSLAKLLDLVIIAAGVGVILLVAALAGAGGTLIIVLVSLLSVLALFGYPALWEALWRGRTPGKATLGLRVVTAEGAPIGPRHAVIRAVLSPVDLVVGAESMLLSPRDRRVGDVVAGTLVMRDKTAATVGPPFWFSPPPGWESYTEALDTTGLTSNEQAVIRSFLLRWREFDGSARLRLAADLAGPLVPRLGPVPQPWLPPDLYLLCVAAARQRRDHQGVQAPTGSAAGAPAHAPPAPPAQDWGAPAPSSAAPPDDTALPEETAPVSDGTAKPPDDTAPPPPPSARPGPHITPPA